MTVLRPKIVSGNLPGQPRDHYDRPGDRRPALQAICGRRQRKRPIPAIAESLEV